MRSASISRSPCRRRRTCRAPPWRSSTSACDVASGRRGRLGRSPSSSAASSRSGTSASVNGASASRARSARSARDMRGAACASRCGLENRSASSAAGVSGSQHRLIATRISRSSRRSRAISRAVLLFDLVGPSCVGDLAVSRLIISLAKRRAPSLCGLPSRRARACASRMSGAGSRRVGRRSELLIVLGHALALAHGGATTFAIDVRALERGDVVGFARRGADAAHEARQRRRHRARSRRARAARGRCSAGTTWRGR